MQFLGVRQAQAGQAEPLSLGCQALTVRLGKAGQVRDASSEHAPLMQSVMAATKLLGIYVSRWSRCSCMHTTIAWADRKCCRMTFVVCFGVEMDAKKIHDAA